MSLRNLIITTLIAGTCSIIASCDTLETPPASTEPDNTGSETESGNTEKADEFVILFTNDFHSQIANRNTFLGAFFHGRSRSPTATRRDRGKRASRAKAQK